VSEHAGYCEELYYAGRMPIATSSRVRCSDGPQVLVQAYKCDSNVTNCVLLLVAGAGVDPAPWLHRIATTELHRLRI
jgi:hypothetical protein